ncbi:MAG: sigma-70 family RNA polymerase sigma factor [Verrucomicrobiota bacterium]
MDKTALPTKMARNNNLDSFEILMHEHQPMLQSYLFGIVRDRHLAEEIAQITFIKAYKNLSRLQKKSSFPAWIRKIGRNTAFDELKKMNREVVTDPEIFLGMEDVFSRYDDSRQADNWRERVNEVKSCFHKLPERLLNIAKMHYQDRLKAKEIASELSLNLATVLKRLERARNSIRSCLGQPTK